MLHFLLQVSVLFGVLYGQGCAGPEPTIETLSVTSIGNVDSYTIYVNGDDVSSSLTDISLNVGENVIALQISGTGAPTGVQVNWSIFGESFTVANTFDDWTVTYGAAATGWNDDTGFDDSLWTDKSTADTSQLTVDGYEGGLFYARIVISVEQEAINCGQGTCVDSTGDTWTCNCTDGYSTSDTTGLCVVSDDCDSDPYNWDIDYLGSSSQFRLFNPCADNNWIKFRMIGITEYDSSGKKTRNKVVSFAGKDFEWNPDSTNEGVDYSELQTTYNGYNTIRNTYYGDVSIPGNGGDVVFRMTTYWYLNDTNQGDNGNGTSNSHSIKWSLYLDSWQFLDDSNTLEIEMDVQVGGGGGGSTSVNGSTIRYSYNNGFTIETPDIENGSVIIDSSNQVHTYITFVFSSFNNELDYDPTAYFRYNTNDEDSINVEDDEDFSASIFNNFNCIISIFMAFIVFLCN